MTEPAQDHPQKPASRWQRIAFNMRNPTHLYARHELLRHHENHALGKDIPQLPYLSPQELAANGFAGLKDFKEHFITSGDAKDALKIGLWVKEPEDDTKPIYVVFHGRNGHWGHADDPRNPLGGDAQYRLHWLEAMAQTGAGVIAVHNRGFGMSNPKLYAGMKRPDARDIDLSEQAYQRDMHAVANHILHERALPSQRLVFAGESMGGAMAAMCAETFSGEPYCAPPKVLALLSSFNKLTDVVHSHTERERDKRKWWPEKEITVEEVEACMPHRFETMGKIARLPPETTLYIAHHGLDPQVEAKHALRNRESAEKNNINHRFRWLEGGYMNRKLRQVDGNEVLVTEFPHTDWNAPALIKDIEDIYYGRPFEEVAPLRQCGWFADKPPQPKAETNGSTPHAKQPSNRAASR